MVRSSVRARWPFSHKALMHFGDISERGVSWSIILPVNLVPPLAAMQDRQAAGKIDDSVDHGCRRGVVFDCRCPCVDVSTEDRFIVVMCYCCAAGAGAFRVVVPCLLKPISHTSMINILSGPQHPICERGDGWYSTSLSISFSNIWLLSSSEDLATSCYNMFTSISLTVKLRVI